MKKISLLLIMALLCSMLFASCAKDENAEKKDVDLSDPTLSIYECVDLPYQYDLSKYITIEKADYIGLEVTKIDTTLTDEEHIKKMNLLLEHLEDNDDVQEVFHNCENCDWLK